MQEASFPFQISLFSRPYITNNFRFKFDTPKLKGREKERQKVAAPSSRPNTVVMEDGEDAALKALQGRAGDEAALERFKEATNAKKKK